MGCGSSCCFILGTLMEFMALTALLLYLFLLFFSFSSVFMIFLLSISLSLSLSVSLYIYIYIYVSISLSLSLFPCYWELLLLLHLLGFHSLKLFCNLHGDFILFLSLSLSFAFLSSGFVSLFFVFGFSDIYNIYINSSSIHILHGKKHFSPLFL